MGRNRTQEGITPIRQADLKENNSFSSKLPYYHCRISLVNTLKENSVACDKHGNIYSAEILLAFVKKFGKNPLTGEEMKLSDIIPVHFYIEDDHIQCPITKKSLMPETVKVALIRTTGNVYAYDTIEQMNIKCQNYQDLVSGRNFDPKTDIIILQDPGRSNLQEFDYWYVENKINWKDLLEPSHKNESSNLAATSAATRKILKEMEELEKKSEKKVAPSKMLYDTTVDSSTSASLTSTAVDVKTFDERKELTSKEEQYKRIRSKNKRGFARMNTSLGPIDFELFAHLAPKACENFITHAKNNYYNNVLFHRIIARFMAQSGDPTGTGRGGKSIWGKSFEDEFDGSLKFDSRGLLACANKGPNTNESQFFITFASCPHLNNKHTIFGKVVGGDDVLDALERTKTGNKDRPLDPPRIESIIVTIDPFEIDSKKQERLKKKNELNESRKIEDSQLGGWFSNPQPKIETVRSGIGKYMKTIPPPDIASPLSNPLKRKDHPSSLPKNVINKRRTLGEFDFSNW